MDKLALKLLEIITDPSAAVLLVVVVIFYKLLDKKETQIEKLTAEIHKNGVTLASVVELLKTLVYTGKGK